jgi:hypothetical protein
MSSVNYAAAFLPLVTHDSAPYAHLYEAWRHGGTSAMLLRHMLSQASMMVVLLLFYVAAVATDYDALRSHVSHPLCPDGIVSPNTATLFETDCWENHPIDVWGRRRAAPAAVFVLVSVIVSMVIEALVSIMSQRHLRNAERWWRDTVQPPATVPPLPDLAWDEVEHFLKEQDPAADITAAITRRSDFYIFAYANESDGGGGLGGDTIPRTMHTAVDAAVQIHRVSGLRLSRCFVVVGAVVLVSAPYLAVAKACRYVFRNVQHLKTGGFGSVLGARRWSRAALWALRDFKEPTHSFGSRMSKAEAEALILLGGVPKHPAVCAIGNFGLVVGGAFTVLILALTVLLDEQVLTATLSPHRTVAFYAAAIGLLLAAAAGAASDPQQVNMPAQLVRVEAHLPQLAGYGDTVDERVARVGEMMQFRATDFAVEVMSLIATPMRLMWVLPKQAPVVERWLINRDQGVEETAM